MPNAFFDIVRNKRTGAGENGVNVELIRQLDDSVLRTTATAGAGNQTGSFGFTEQLYDYQGPTRIEATDGEGVVHVHTSQSVGQIGPWRATDLARAWQIMTNGVVLGVEGDLEVTANGSDMLLAVAPGLAFCKGLVYWWPLNRHPTVTNNTSGSVRFDLVALQFYPQGHVQEGRIDLVLAANVGGVLVPGADPVLPGSAFGLDATTWVLPLATIQVDNGVTSIAANKVTDARVGSKGPMLPEMITATELQTGAVTFPKIHPEAWPIFVKESQSAANTANTSNTVASGGTVQAIQSTFEAGPGTWTIAARYDASYRHSTDDRIHHALEVEGVETGGDFFVDSAIEERLTIVQTKTGVAGNQSIIVRGRYCGKDSGLTNCRNPALDITAYRTA